MSDNNNASSSFVASAAAVESSVATKRSHNEMETTETSNYKETSINQYKDRQ